jgi:hypothetical protein
MASIRQRPVISYQRPLPPLTAGLFLSVFRSPLG